MKRSTGLFSMAISMVFLAVPLFAEAPQKPATVSANNVKQAPASTKTVTPVPPAGKSSVPASAAVKPQATPAAPPAANATVPPTASNAPLGAAPLALNPKETYSYNPFGKPDPFKPFIEIETAEKKKKEERKTQAATSIFPLQRQDTENYRVVGIAGDQDHRVAIVEDEAKKFYPLHKGTRIGLNNGKVVDILQDRVIVEEYEEGKAKRVTLKLHKN